MKYTNHTVAGSLRVNYERYLYPYERFLVKMGKLELKSSMSHDSQRAATPRLATPSPVKSETSTPTKCKYGLRQNRRRPSHLEVQSITMYEQGCILGGGDTGISPCCCQSMRFIFHNQLPNLKPYKKDYICLQCGCLP